MQGNHLNTKEPANPIVQGPAEYYVWQDGNAPIHIFFAFFPQHENSSTIRIDAQIKLAPPSLRFLEVLLAFDQFMAVVFGDDLTPARRMKTCTQNV